MYEKIGDSFGLLTQSEQLFRADSHMLRPLISMYKDIFEFHRQALKYFRQPRKLPSSDRYQSRLVEFTWVHSFEAVIPGNLEDIQITIHSPFRQD